MAVQYVRNNNGGGFFSRLLPQILNMAGTAVGGPLGGQAGSMIGSAAAGNSPAIAAQLINSIQPGNNQSAGNPAPAQTQFPAFQGSDWGNPASYLDWLKMRG